MVHKNLKINLKKYFKLDSITAVNSDYVFFRVVPTFIAEDAAIVTTEGKLLSKCG
jgi:hypothetical protein